MKIDYLSGSRADFGLMLPCLRALGQCSDFDCRVVVTAQHLAPGYGNTVTDIEASGLEIAARIPVKLSGADGAEMAIALSDELRQLVDYWRNDGPDAIMLLGDRGEMVAGALAAIHLGVPVIHVAGGERSGTLDESFRHAITKLSHVHLCSTGKASERIERMGEKSENIHVIGAPGLVGIHDAADEVIDLAREFGLTPDKPVALVIYHPVVQEASEASKQAREVLEALRRAGYAQLVLRPNSDAGGAAINSMLDGMHDTRDLIVIDHLNRRRYLSVLRNAQLIAGNSSSGIVESASMRTACLNIGSRQFARDRNPNTIDCPVVRPEALDAAISQAKELPLDGTTIYGNGDADTLMIEALRRTEFSSSILAKTNTY